MDWNDSTIKKIFMLASLEFQRSILGELFILARYHVALHSDLLQ